MSAKHFTGDFQTHSEAHARKDGGHNQRSLRVFHTSPAALLKFCLIWIGILLHLIENQVSLKRMTKKPCFKRSYTCFSARMQLKVSAGRFIKSMIKMRDSSRAIIVSITASQTPICQNLTISDAIVHVKYRKCTELCLHTEMLFCWEYRDSPLGQLGELKDPSKGILRVTPW